jgi:hypothetical protein
VRVRGRCPEYGSWSCRICWTISPHTLVA